MAKTNGISAAALNKYSEKFNSDRANLVAANASCANGLAGAATDYQAVRKLENTFSIDLEDGSVTNQKSSGRCWIFSALNTFRFELMKKNNLADFELSQNYMFFYDKLEKANYFLESVIRIADQPVDGRLYSWLNMMPLGDGGQWDMLVNLVNKYGVCPKSAYPDSANSTASHTFVSYLTGLLREDAACLRKLVNAGASAREVQKVKDGMLNDIYRVLVISLGEPPKKFDFTWTDKDKKVTQEFGITPQDFFKKYVGLNLDEYISVINAPTEDKPFNKMYTVRFLGNVVEGNPVRYLNLTMDEMKAGIIKQLRDGHPVWFGSDVSKFGVRADGIWDRASVNVEQLLNIHFDFTKGDKLTYGESAMNHAMVILGVNLDENGKPNRWRIENSWGTESGKKGYYIMSDEWFDEYVYQAAINRRYLPKKTVALTKGELNELEPWDPMGTLAD